MDTPRSDRRRAYLVRGAIALAVVVFLGIVTQQYVGASAALDDSRDTLERARAAVSRTRGVGEEQATLARTAVSLTKQARGRISTAVQRRKEIEVQIADAQQQLSQTNELVRKAAESLFTVAGESNDVRTCLDGVTRATVLISNGDDNGALDALLAASDACAQTLVAGDATVMCAQGSLGSSSALQEFFDRRSELWAGADLTGVVPLPDGRNLWLFGDTMYTPVEENGGRGALVGFGNNSAFVESGGCMRHVSGNGSQRSWVTPPHADGSIYWPGGGVVVGSTLHVFLGRMKPEPPFGRLLDRAVATFSLPDLQLRGITPLPFGPADPGWGSGTVLGGDGHVYVYGPRRPDCDNCFASDVYVARAPARAVTDVAAWTYWDGAAWSADRGAAKPVISGAGAHVNVQPWRGGYLAIAKAADIMSSDIAAWWAPAPGGPWTATGSIHHAAAPTANGYTYMPNVVPRRGGGALVFAYNVGTLDDAESRANAALYGPRFVTVSVPTLPGMQ
jgi:hypothetical protein